MTEKIEWYKEVLELEPNSKVFLPLAHLYASRNQIDEAVAALEHGLSRHPEHMEARLFLIELLYKAGRQSECTVHVREMSRLFSSYAHFWQAWAVCLRTAGEAPEMSAALRLMAVNFLYGPISVTTLMEKGLDAVLGELTPAADKVADKILAAPSPAETAPAAADVETRPAADVSVADESDTAAAAPVAAATAPVAAESDTAADADSPAAEAHTLAAPTPHPFTADSDTDDENDDDVLPADMPLPRDAELDMPVSFAGEEDSAGIVGDEPAEEAAVASADALTPAAPPLVVAPAAQADGGADEGEEGYSLRTRSMAEVLAEQGDVRGALDIYQELEKAAATPEERADLQQRIATLSARLSGQPILEAATDQPLDAVPGKEKLINVLEALAERVEARAQN